MLFSCSFLVIRRLLPYMYSAKNRDYSKIIYEKDDRLSSFDTIYPKSYLNEASIYVHWPYCKKRCHFCNFNKYIESNVNHKRMRECLVLEIETLLEESGIKTVSSVFFGGGTPNLAEPWTIEAVLREICKNVKLTKGAEITLEVNPLTTSSFSLKDFKLAGINRVSVGVQDLDNQRLELLGRDHSAEEALHTLKQAKELFPEHTSADILYGLPGQSLECWNKTLDEFIPLLDSHVSVYQLTLERGTKLFKMCQEGKLNIPNENVIDDMYDLSLEKLHKYGFYAYEISNFSRNVHTRSVHNMAYWQGKQYIGIGPGAHGRFVPQNSNFTKCGSPNKSLKAVPDGMREARIQTLEPLPWMKEVETFGHGTRLRKPQRKSEVLGELLSTGLRTIDGVTEDNWSTLCQEAPSLFECFAVSSKTKWLFENGLLNYSIDGIKATYKGWKVLDYVVPHLLEQLDRVFVAK